METTSIRIDHAHITTNEEGDLVIKRGSLTGARVVLLNSTIEILPGTEFDMEPWGAGSQYKGNKVVGALLPDPPPTSQGGL